LAITIEFVSVFGPTVLASYAEATERRDEAPAGSPVERAAEVTGLVIDYLAERIETAANTETLSQSALYADYAACSRL
jgi:hypothetical protein